MKKNLWGICALTAWVSAVSYAQQSDSTRVNQLDEVVISDTKFAQRKEKSGKVIVKISRESLEQRKGQTLAQVLSTVAGTQYQFHDMQTQTPFGAQRREATKFALIDPYITLVWTTAWGGNLNAGARWNHHSEYGNKVL